MPARKKAWLTAVAVILGLLGLPADSPVHKIVTGVADALWQPNNTRGRGGKAVRAAKGGRYGGLVVGVHDGDTVRVEDGGRGLHKIRLAYIDAPEMGQDFGQDSRDKLRGQVLEQKVSVKVNDIDQYGREVAQIELDGRDINLEQLKNGAAWHYASIAKRQQDKAAFGQYAAAEAAAREGRRGLWARDNPVAPWTFRKQKKAQGR